jgi:hypothetical protein
MRYIKEIAHPGLTVGVYVWNNKFIVKIDAGPYEQTYKISEMDVATVEEVEAMLDGPFLATVRTRFAQMNADWQQTRERSEE